jgi:hypothetical protein
MSPAEYQATQPHAQMAGGQWLWSPDSPSVPKAKKTRPSMDETWVNVKVEVKVEEVCADDGVYGTDTAEYAAYQIIDTLTEPLGHAGERSAPIKEERIFKTEE